MRWRRTARLAYRGSNTGREQEWEAACHATQSRHHAPQERTNGEDISPARAVSERGDRDTERCIEKRERETAEQALLGIGRVERVFDRLEEHGEDRAVHDIHRVGERQKRQHVAGIPARRERARIDRQRAVAAYIHVHEPPRPMPRLSPTSAGTAAQHTTQYPARRARRIAPTPSV